MGQPGQKGSTVRILRGLLCLCLLSAGLAACSRSNALLEQPALMPGQTSGNLTVPPPENLAKADPNAPPEIVKLCADGTLPMVGAVAGTDGCSPLPASEDADIAAAFASDAAIPANANKALWRGKSSAGGIDLVNAAGVMCSGTNEGGDPSRFYYGKRLTLACSDGSVAYLSTGSASRSASLRLGDRTERVELR